MEQTNVQITQAQPTLTVEIVQNLIPVMTAQVTVGGGSGPAPVFGDTLTGTGTPADPVNVSNDILDQLDDNTQTIQDNATQIQDIQDLIPATANQDNQLADQGFVNSSIQTATAYFRGDWATWADVPSDPELYPVDATGNHTPTTNDYMVVIADEQTNGGTWRYKYTGLWSEQGKSGWQAEYQVNETPLTAAQLAALNSGATAESIASFVKKTDYASSSTGGVIKVASSRGLTVYDGYLYTRIITLNDYLTTADNTFIGKGTLENIKYDLVKRAVTTNDIVLTDEEKAAAQAWLGVESGGGASLPDQTGNAGKFLQTDGATLSWGAALVNRALYQYSLVVGDGATETQYSNGSKRATIFGTNAKTAGAGSDSAVVVGMAATAYGSYGVAVGFSSYADYLSVAVGYDTYAGIGSIALGYKCSASASGVFEVALAQSLSSGIEQKQYRLLDYDGTIPLERLKLVTDQIGDISTALTAILGE